MINEELTENQVKVLIENGDIDYKVNGSTDGIDLGKRRKYFSWLNSCSFVSDNGKIVKLVLKENTESQKVFFEAYVAWYDKYGGFFMNGNIDLVLNSISADVYWENKDIFENFIVNINELERKKMK